MTSAFPRSEATALDGRGQRCGRRAHPASPVGGGVGSRVFDIFCNGVSLRRGFDIFKEAHGAERGMTWSVHGIEPDAHGLLSIALTPLRNYASVNALEVVDESN